MRTIRSLLRLTVRFFVIWIVSALALLLTSWLLPGMNLNRLSPTDCGLPSQTSYCQAGILFGDSHDIPAFRWYDKTQSKLYVSSKDATEINGRYASGNGQLTHRPLTIVAQFRRLSQNWRIS